MPKKPSEESNITDWSALRTSLITFCLGLIIGILIILAVYQYHNYITNWEQQQRRDFGQIESKYVQLQQALKIVNNSYLEKYYQLKKEGFYSDANHLTIQEQYLNTSNNLRNLLARLPLFKKDSDYNFSAQEPYIIPKINDPKLKIYKTAINLKLSVLHEGNILKSLETIEFQQFSGLFNLQKCDIKRKHAEIDVTDVSKPYFNANCILVWYISVIEKS